MGMFDELREARQVSLPLAEPEERVTYEVPSFEREAAAFEPCMECSCGIPSPLFWESTYGDYHCLCCVYPPMLSMVKRVVALVPLELPADYLITPQRGFSGYDLVERPDWMLKLKQAELKKDRLKREAKEDSESDGY